MTTTQHDKFQGPFCLSFTLELPANVHHHSPICGVGLWLYQLAGLLINQQNQNHLN